MAAPVGLVVDDEPMIRAVFSEALRRSGILVFEAASGSSALALAQATTPDVVVTDIQMPGGDGIELCRTLRGDPALNRVRIVVVSGMAATQGAAAVAAGCDAVIEKPCRPTVLIATIQRLLALPTP
jgi:two-component system response regulator MprA